MAGARDGASQPGEVRAQWSALWSAVRGLSRSVRDVVSAWTSRHAKALLASWAAVIVAAVVFGRYLPTWTAPSSLGGGQLTPLGWLALAPFIVWSVVFAAWFLVIMGMVAFVCLVVVPWYLLREGWHAATSSHRPPTDP